MKPSNVFKNQKEMVEVLGVIHHQLIEYLLDHFDDDNLENKMHRSQSFLRKYRIKCTLWIDVPDAIPFQEDYKIDYSSIK